MNPYIESTPHGWNVFDSTPAVLTRAYKLGVAESNALAVAGAGGVIVFSPPYRAGVGVFDDLARFGPVRALVATNAFHHKGIPEWKRRFPEVAIYAPAQSIARVERQTKLSGIRPLSEAAALCGDSVELVDMPNYRTGEVLVRLRTSRGLAWYVTDIVLNLTRLPSNPLLALLFRMTASAPGLKVNQIGPRLMTKDFGAVKRWLAQEAGREPPRWLIPTHGEVLDLGADASPLVQVLTG